jgi:hypothetical protein
MSICVHHEIKLEGRNRDIKRLLAAKSGSSIESVVGCCWEFTVTVEEYGFRELYCSSKRFPEDSLVAALSSSHPSVLIEWSYFCPDCGSEGVVVASGGTIHATGSWDAVDCDDDTEDADPSPMDGDETTMGNVS